MRGNKRVDTKPEIAIRSLLHRRGLRFRKDYTLRANGRVTRPDIVFTRRRVAVYIDGCFWHQCPEHGTRPRANAAYWEPKLRRNVERDREVDRALRAAGWTVIRMWEHDEPAWAVDEIAQTLQPPESPVTRGPLAPAR
jgi:DNA mismatch endonuclease, patch repair protein